MQKERNRVATIEPTAIASTPDVRVPQEFYDPTLTDTPSHIIGRPVRIGTYTLTAASSAAIHIPIVNPWTTNATITKALSPYNMMRPTFELQFLTRCSSTIYGMIQMGYYYGPITKPYPYVTLDETIQLSSAHTHMQSVASSGAVTMNVPFVFPYEWMSTTDVTHDQLFTAFVSNLGISSLEAGADTNVDIEVWVTCTDIQVQGLVAQSTFAAAGLVAAGATGAQFASKAYNTLDSIEQTSNTIRHLSRKVKIANDVNKANNVVDGFPAYGAAVGIKDAQYGDVNSLSRQVQLPRLTEMTINNKLNSSVYGDTMQHRLSELASHGTILHTEQFTAKGQSFSIDLRSEYFGEWHKYIMSHFRYFRGRPRFKLWFVTSPLLAFRFQVSYSRNPLFTVDAGTSDVSKMNFLVKGSEEVIVEIPYVNWYPIAHYEATIGKLVIECTQLATSLTTTGNSSCFLCLVPFMAPDTQYFSVQAPKLVKYTGQSLRAVVYEPVSLDFSSAPHMQTSLYDEVETVEELMLRWSTRDKTPSSNGILDTTLQKNPTYPTAFSKWGDKCDAFTCIYTLYRGSRDFRILTTSTTTNEDVWVSVPQDVSYVSQLGELANGTQYFATKTKTGVAGALTFEAYMEFTAPWINSVVADTVYNTTFGTTEPLPLDTNYVDSTKFWSRAGSDYQVFVLNMLPQGFRGTTLVPIPP